MLSNNTMLIAISFVCLCMVVGVRGVGVGVVTLCKSGSSFQCLLILEVGKCVWVWVCASVRRSWHINVADETSTSGRVTKSAGSLYQRALGGLLFFISQCVSIRAPQLSEPSEPGAPAPSAPSASHRRGRSGAKKHREMGADVSAEFLQRSFRVSACGLKQTFFFFFWISLVLCLLSVTTSRERDVLRLTRMKNRIHSALLEASV